MRYEDRSAQPTAQEGDIGLSCCARLGRSSHARSTIPLSSSVSVFSRPPVLFISLNLKKGAWPATRCSSRSRRNSAIFSSGQRKIGTHNMGQEPGQPKLTRVNTAKRTFQDAREDGWPDGFCGGKPVAPPRTRTRIRLPAAFDTLPATSAALTTFCSRGGLLGNLGFAMTSKSAPIRKVQFTCLVWSPQGSSFRN
jgi:hypothetical protein